MSTVDPDGSPNCTPVWVDRDGGIAVVNSRLGRRKVRNLERDPRATLTVVARDDPYMWVQVRGAVELTRSGIGA